MANRVIAISRQFGSGGRTVGRRVAEKLGIPCYDNELIEKIAEKSGFAKEYIKERSEDAATGNWFLNAFSRRDYDGRSFEDDLWDVQSRVILDLAEKESCVIVGRCADYVLQGKADLLTVFIHADREFRAKRIVEQYGQRDASPEKRIIEKDKRRIAYYQFYTDRKWGNAENYHIALDAGVLGIEKCADIITQLY